MMKVLILTTHMNIGGIGLYCLNLGKYMRLKGVEVIVVSSGGELVPRLESAGIRHIDLPIGTKFEFSWKMFRAIPRLIDIVKKNGISIIHAQTRVSQVLAFFVSKLHGIPYVATCHGFFRHDRLGRKLIPCWGDITIAISKGVKKHLVEDLSVPTDKVVQIYNGIEIDKFGVKKDRGLAADIGIREGSRVIGSVGRFSGVKGYEYLIDAFGLLSTEHTDLCLLLVGAEGGIKDVLQKTAADKGLSHKVFFATGGDIGIEKYLALMDIFCLPSTQEGLGLSIIEAMASGVPCIASRVGGIPEIIEDGIDGVLIPPRDPVSIAREAERLLRDGALAGALVENARRKVARVFSVEDFAEQTIDVYKRAGK